MLEDITYDLPVRILFVVSGGVLALIGLGGRVGAEFGAELN